MEQGVDLSVGKRLLTSLRRQGQCGPAGVLKCTLEGGQWTQDRIWQASGGKGSNICPRCGKDPETAKHRYYECEANERIDDRIMQESARFVSRAKQNFDEFPCFWGRGIVPACWTQVHLKEPIVRTWHEQRIEQ